MNIVSRHIWLPCSKILQDSCQDLARISNYCKLWKILAKFLSRFLPKFLWDFFEISYNNLAQNICKIFQVYHIYSIQCIDVPDSWTIFQVVARISAKILTILLRFLQESCHDFRPGFTNHWRLICVLKFFFTFLSKIYFVLGLIIIWVNMDIIKFNCIKYLDISRIT
jgi:hypothetical protein